VQGRPQVLRFEMFDLRCSSIAITRAIHQVVPGVVSFVVVFADR
jgi:hypothetical protein